jgi:hypothetical protein
MQPINGGSGGGLVVIRHKELRKNLGKGERKMKYKVGDKVLYTCENGIYEPVEAKITSLTGGTSYPYMVVYERNRIFTEVLARDAELSPLEPEQLRQ